MDIILIDDDLAEIEVISEIILAKGKKYKLTVINNRTDKADYLSKIKEIIKIKDPEIIILRDDLSGKSGYDVLSDMKQNLLFPNSIVIMIVSAPNAKGVLGANQLGIDGFFPKPEDSFEYLELMNGILSMPAGNYR
jgi:CheY-like chemotaxis protein